MKLKKETLTVVVWLGIAGAFLLGLGCGYWQGKWDAENLSITYTPPVGHFNNPTREQIQRIQQLLMEDVPLSDLAWNGVLSYPGSL